jgi:Leucine-rich repeat (LRR) protein
LLQALPRCLVKLPKLSTLVASHNPIAELPGGISKLSGLLDLHMSHCALRAVPQVRLECAGSDQVAGIDYLVPTKVQRCSWHRSGCGCLACC